MFSLNLDFNLIVCEQSWVLFSFKVISIKRSFFFYISYVFFVVQSESEIRFFAVEPINTFLFVVVVFNVFWFVCLVRLGYFRLGYFRLG